MIHIGKPYIEKKGERAFLKAPVAISEDTAKKYVERIDAYRPFSVWLTEEDYPPASWKEEGTLWFDAPERFAKYLCPERSNAFVTALFWYGMASGSDIEFETPMSARLYRGFTESIMPALEKNGFPAIRLMGPVTDEPVWCEGGVISGLSGGVDSFYTMLCYGGEQAPQDKKLTHLSHYTCSYLFKPADVYKGVETLYREEDEIEDIILKRVKRIAAEKGFPLIDTNTNLDRDFYRGGYVFMAMYRYLSCTLAMEHLYSTYISSSSGHEGHVTEVSLFVPTQHYEDLLCSSLRTETFSYFSSDNVSRIEKIRAIGDDPVFQRTATECFATGPKGENCGECYGCLKTIIPLDLLGKLEGFKESFDLEDYEKKRAERFAFLIDFSKRPEASSARETVRQLLELAEKEESEAGNLFLEIYKKKNPGASVVK